MSATLPGPASVAGHYTFVLHHRHRRVDECSHYACLADLAKAVDAFVREQAAWYPTPHCHPRAYSPNDRALDVVALAAHGARLARNRWPRWWPHCDGYVRRQGPVPGIHRPHHGCSLRHPQTMSERRAAALVIAEDGEVGPRAARGLRHIPHSWDDRPRGSQRSWKSQHKGRKAWDRG